MSTASVVIYARVRGDRVTMHSFRVTSSACSVRWGIDYRDRSDFRIEERWGES